MDNRLHISFFVNKHGGNSNKYSVYIRVTIAGVRENINTGITVMKDQWDGAKSRVKGKSDLALSGNKLISALITKITDAYTECVKHDLPITSLQVKSMVVSPETKHETLLALFNSHNTYVLKQVNSGVSFATYRKYQIVLNKVKDFLHKELKKDDIPLSQLNNSFAVKFELYLKADNNIGHNTTIKYIQSLKKVINYGIAMEWLKYDPLKAFKCTLHGVNRECLTQEELDALTNKVIAIERLAVVRDVFVFSCYTGLAYVDVQKLKYSEIVKGVDGKQWIQTYRAKTQTRVPVPLLPKALELIERYRTTGGRDSKVFPIASNQKVNAYLKELADMCGISKTLTFHIARHTFATTVTLTNGVPIETVSKMLGHTNIKTTQLYSKVVDTKISNDMAALEVKLGSNSKADDEK
jgi:site-specific recombinase XerD